MEAGERLARLTLARADRVGPVTFRQLITRFGSAARAFAALPDLARRGGASGYAPPDPRRIEAELQAGERVGARLLIWGEADFPPLLAPLDPPPPVVWALGDAALLSTARPIAIVGARVASAAGQRIARGLASALGQAGFIVVSGLARGIDAAAHQGSLETGTVAVLAGGVDDIYPPDNAGLYREIVTAGCVVAESPMGARATARDFPRRNRIISGLSLGVVVVEAEARSGSLITARLAGEQGREVFAVPGSPLDPRARGPNDLIRNGAVLCEGVDDIVRALDTLRTLSEPPAADWTDMTDAEPDARLIERVAALLSPTPAPRDEIARALDMPVALVSSALLELSLAGRAELLPGGLVAAA